MTESYPLYWPDDWRRTPSAKRMDSQFKTTPGRVIKNLRDQIRMPGGRNLIISSNVPVRQDGGFYSDWDRQRIDDPGVAVYFDLRGTQMSFACDQYSRPFDNAHAIGKTIEALRGIERWGASDMMERAFRGFARLAGPGQERPWWEVLGVSRDASPDEIKAAWRSKARDCHPDAGGSDAQMAEINAAYEKSKAA